MSGFLTAAQKMEDNGEKVKTRPDQTKAAQRNKEIE